MRMINAIERRTRNKKGQVKLSGYFKKKKKNSLKEKKRGKSFLKRERKRGGKWQRCMDSNEIQTDEDIGITERWTVERIDNIEGQTDEALNSTETWTDEGMNNVERWTD